MKTVTRILPEATPGTQHRLSACHFFPPARGEGGAHRKVYIQAALHADEIPSLLVAQALKQRLVELEERGLLRWETVLLTVANPIGLAQSVLGNHQGRFELATGQNFNRGYPFLAREIVARVEGQLGADAQRNVQLVRSAWREALEQWAVRTEFEALQQQLMLFAHDADIVLDLHCSKEAAMHLYTSESTWQEVMPLACYIGARATLLAADAGGQPFDEALSYTWMQLHEQLGKRFPLPISNVVTTVEHRGNRDVSHALAAADAQAIVDYLTYVGAIDGTPPPLPPLFASATPLAGSEQFHAPASGIVVYRAAMGDRIAPGDALFDIVDPITGDCTTLRSQTEGVFYMGRDSRFAKLGDVLGRVSGSKPIRTGKLLSA
jgi:predicted deacylase